MHVQPQWVNKHLFPSFIDDKQSEPKMMLRLVALVKRVAELHETGLWACHCSEELTLMWIHSLGRREKLAYECPWLADPSREPAASKIFTLTFYILMVCFLNLTCYVYCTALNQEEIDQVMAHLFDKDLPTPQPAGVHVPFSNENLPPEVKISSLSDILYLHCLTKLSCF
jgi:hypothetical protein